MHMLTLALSDAEQSRFLHHVEERPYERPVVAHARAAAKREGLNLVLYSSGKLVAQGKGLKEWVEFVLEPEIIQRSSGLADAQGPSPTPVGDFSPHIGIDESGKGDFFGPMVIAAFLITPALAERVTRLGVRDSKLSPNDSKVAAIAAALREAAPTHCKEIVLAPETYNSLIARMGSVNRVLAWAHASALEALLERHPQTPRAVADQFGAEHLIRNALKTRGKGIELTQMHKAESDPAVAAASILARDGFVRVMKSLSDDVGETLPKGATHVRPSGEALVRRLGPDILKKVAKTHFRTTRQVLEACGHDPALLGTPEPKDFTGSWSKH